MVPNVVTLTVTLTDSSRIHDLTHNLLHKHSTQKPFPRTAKDLLILVLLTGKLLAKHIKFVVKLKAAWLV